LEYYDDTRIEKVRQDEAKKIYEKLDAITRDRMFEVKYRELKKECGVK